MKTYQIVLLILIVFPIAFIGLWSFALWILSHVGGWQALAKQYRTTRKPSGNCFNSESIRLGLVNYNFIGQLCSTPEGLHLSVWSIFKIGHPPLLIPWSELHNPQPVQFLWQKTIRFDIGSPKITTISLSEKVYKAFPRS